MPTFREDKKLGTKVPLIKTDDLSDGCVTEEKLSYGVRLLLNGVPDLKLSDLNIMTEKLALQYAKGELAFQYRLIDSEGHVVGTVLYLSDSMAHAITQVVITREDLEVVNSHHDTIVNIRYRSWGLTDNKNLGVPLVKGGWTDWAPLVDPIIRDAIVNNTNSINDIKSKLESICSSIPDSTIEEIINNMH